VATEIVVLSVSVVFITRREDVLALARFWTQQRPKKRAEERER
jgi:hypothetical protein